MNAIRTASVRGAGPVMGGVAAGRGAPCAVSGVDAAATGGVTVRAAERTVERRSDDRTTYHGSVTGPRRRVGRGGPVVLTAALLALAAAACGGAPRAAFAPLPPLSAPDPAAVPPAGPIPAPPSVRGSEPPVGEAGEPSPDWHDLTAYLAALDSASPRLRVDTIGRSTRGRPLVLATVADPGTLAQLDLHRSVQQRLADPRRAGSSDELDRMLAHGRAVVLVVGGGGPDAAGEAATALRAVHHLAGRDGPVERAILAGTIVLIVPSLIPDGIDRTARERDRGRDEPWADAEAPFHPYAGADLAADVPGLTQVETRLLVERVVRAWHPHAVHMIGSPSDQGRAPGPPWPALFSSLAVPPEIQGGPSVGDAAKTEPAGAEDVRPAAPSRTGREDPAPARRADPAPARELMRDHARVLATLERAAAQRESWLRHGFAAARAAVGVDGVDGRGAGADPGAAAGARIRTERDAAAHPTTVAGGEGGAAVAGWVLTPAHRPAAATRTEPAPVPGAPLEPRARGASPASSTDSMTTPGLAELIRMLTTAGVDVRRMLVPLRVGGREFTAGTHIVPARQPQRRFARVVLGDAPGSPLAALLGVATTPFMLPDGDLDGVPISTRPVVRASVRRDAAGLTGAGGAAPRIAVYRAHPAVADEGWTRWLLDAYRIPYSTVGDDDIRRGDLADRADVIVFPSQPATAIYAGHGPGAAPDAYAGGLGALGTSALAAFVRAGGTLVTLGRATRYAIEYLGMPVRDGELRLDDSTRTSPVPGAVRPPTGARVTVDTRHPLGAGSPPEVVAWADEALELRATDAAAVTVARYATGGDAMVVVRMGDGSDGRGGRVVLFGFRPHYRGLNTATLPLLFNVLRSARNR